MILKKYPTLFEEFQGIFNVQRPIQGITHLAIEDPVGSTRWPVFETETANMFSTELLVNKGHFRTYSSREGPICSVPFDEG